MRTIKKLINTEKKVYIFLKNRAIQYRFMSDAEREGITYGDNVKPTERKVDDIMALQPNGTICFLGWAGRMCYHYNKKMCFVLIMKDTLMVQKIILSNAKTVRSHSRLDGLYFFTVFKKIVLVFLFAKLIALCNQRIYFQSN